MQAAFAKTEFVQGNGKFCVPIGNLYHQREGSEGQLLGAGIRMVFAQNLENVSGPGTRSNAIGNGDLKFFT